MPVARWFTPVLLLLFALLEHLFSDLVKGDLKSIIPESGDQLPASTIILVVISIIVAWTLNQKSSRDYFGETS